MDSSRSRSFALVFIAAIAVGAVALVLVAERSLRSRETWTLEIDAHPTPDGWTLRAEPSRSIHLYAVTEDRSGELRLVFPGPADGRARPLPTGARFDRQFATGPDAVLLVFADPHPLWSLEESRAQDPNAAAAGFVRLSPEDLAEIRGLAPDATLDALPTGPDGTATVRGLFARRFERS